MLCYTGVPFVRVYLPKKDRRLAWKLYLASCSWGFENLSDLKGYYEKLFQDWNNESKWEESEGFIDDMY